MSAATNLSVDEQDTSLADLLDRVERGEEITVSRHGRPIARLVPAPVAHDVERARRAVEKLAELREQLRAEHGTVSLEEILAWRHEGHRY